MGFVGYQISNILVFFLNCSNRFLPGLNKASLYISLTSFLTITLAVLIASPKKASAGYASPALFVSHDIST